MSDAQANADRVRRAYARWEASRGVDADAFLELLADDVVMRSLLNPPDLHPLAQERVGKEFARDYLESLALNLEMLAFPTEEVVAQGDTVVWIGSCRWRDRKTGAEADTPKADVWHFRGGKAVSVMEFFDTLGFARLNRLV
ncbi:MAG: nuclear transport factor 2 family protein [Pseudomonadota bacterium]